MNSKICSICSIEKDLVEFHKNEYGKFGRHSTCKECYNKGKRRDYVNRKDHHRDRLKTNKDIRRKMVDEFKSRPCKDCGVKFHSEVMDLDHLDSVQKIEKVSRLVDAGGIESIAAELKKCEVVCANCHRIRTVDRGLPGGPRKHEDVLEVYKTCSRCKIRQDLSEFYIHPQMKSGRLNICKDCHRCEGIRNKKKTTAWMVQLKNVPCLDCGKSYPSCVMDFDHRPGEPKVSQISHLVATKASKEIILAEIAKCDLVCANCHRIRTFNRRQK